MASVVAFVVSAAGSPAGRPTCGAAVAPTDGKRRGVGGRRRRPARSSSQRRADLVVSARVTVRPAARADVVPAPARRSTTTNGVPRCPLVSAALPPAQGLYDPASEHDACGVAFVATLPGEAGHDIVDAGADRPAQPRAPRRRRAPSRTPATAPGILTPGPGRVPARRRADFELPPRRARTPSASRSCPTTTRRAASAVGAIERIAAEEGLTRPRLARPAHRRPTSSGATARAVHAAVPAAVRRRRPATAAWPGWRSTGWRSAAQARRARGRRLLPVAVGAHARLQGHAHHRPAGAVLPRPVRPRGSPPRSPWCTRASPPTPSRRWPLAHPYRLIAHNGEINTVKGNRNWMRAREAQLASDADPGRPRRGSSRSAPPGGSDSASLRRGAGAAAPGGPVAAARGADDDPGGVGEPRRDGPGPAGVLRVPRHAHRAVGRPGVRSTFTDGTRDRRGARPQRPAPGPLLGHRRRPRRAGQRGRRARPRPGDGRAQGPAAARPDVPGRHRAAAASSTTRRSRPSSPPSSPTTSGCTPGSSTSTTCPSASTSCTPTSRVVRRQQTFGYTEEELRVLLAPMARTGAEPIGSMGTDTPIAVLSDRPRLLFDYFTQLFAQVTNPPLDAIREELVTSLRHPSAPSSNLLDGHAGALPAGRPAVPGDRQRRAGQDPAHQRRRRPARLRARRRSAASTGSTAAATALARAARRDLRRGVARRSRDGARVRRALRPRLRRRPRADPVAAADRRGAPPPGPRARTRTQVGAARRGRRRARGAPRRAAHRLRRRGGQPVPRDGDASRTSSAPGVIAGVDPGEGRRAT